MIEIHMKRVVPKTQETFVQLQCPNLFLQMLEFPKVVNCVSKGKIEYTRTAY